MNSITAPFAGGRVQASVTAAAITVVVEHDGGAREHAMLPYPGAGVGGHELVVSPTGRYLALFLFSGQSEQGYELFELRPALRHLGGLPYAVGVGEPPRFSADERWIAMVTVVDATFGVDDRDEDADEVVVDWGDLRAQSLPGGEVQRCALRASVPGDLAEPEESAYPDLRFTASGVVVSTPWGAEVAVALPLPAFAVVRGPRE